MTNQKKDDTIKVSIQKGEKRLNTRIRAVREKLKFSRAVFGQRIGVSGDTINNLERGRIEIKDSIIKLICAEFNVNEKWLRNGIEPMFIVTPSNIMEQLKKEFNLDEFAYNLVYEYLKLEPKQRDAVRNFFYKVVKGEPETQNTDMSETQKNDDFWESCTTEEAEAAYIKSRSKTAKKTAHYVSSTIADITDSKNAEKAANQ